jgi:aryl-alcohol dehydrogenase-like predicted oxidoreductase
MKTAKDFILGTANLGMQYGITNKKEHDIRDSRNILNAAIRYGINTFDTSPSYGEAENLIGEKAKKVPNLRAITKIPEMESYDFDSVYKSLTDSAKKTGTENLYGVLFHDPYAHKVNNLNQLSKQILETGITKKIGFSAYSVEDILQGKEKNPIWNFFQIPENIADRRNFNSPELISMSKSGDTFHVRSVFLQGLLLINENELDLKFNELRFLIRNLDKKAKNLDVTLLDLCISYTQRIPWSSGTIIGVASENQLKSIFQYSDCELELDDLPVLSSYVLDPRNW